MKDYLLISNTKDNKLKGNLLDLISFKIEKSINESIFYKELSPGKAYEWELTPKRYNQKLKNLMSHLKKKL